MNETPVPGNSLVISSLVLRKAVGWLGIALPLVLAIGALLVESTGLQSSISGYYYTGMRDAYVGIVCAIGVLLMSYKGHEPVDARAGELAGISAIGLALFPVAPDFDPTTRQIWIGYFHFLFAALFFLALACLSLFLFPRTATGKKPTRRKLQRNAVYRACGHTMLAALILVVVIASLPGSAIPEVRKLEPIFWLESVAVIAFGISWLTKGQAILKDEAAS